MSQQQNEERRQIWFHDDDCDHASVGRVKPCLKIVPIVPIFPRFPRPEGP